MDRVNRFTLKPEPQRPYGRPAGYNCERCSTPVICDCIQCGAPNCCPKCCNDASSDLSIGNGT